MDVLAFNDRGHLLSFRKENLHCRIRDLLSEKTNNLIAEIPEFNCGVFDAAVTPDGQCFVVEGWSLHDRERRRIVRAYEGLTGKVLWTVPSTKTNIWGAIIPDIASKFVVLHINNPPKAVLVELSSGTVVKALPWLPRAFHSETSLFVLPGRPPIHERGCSIFFGPVETPAITLGIDQPTIQRPQFDQAGNQLAWGNTDGTVTVCNLEEINERLAVAGLQWLNTKGIPK